MPKQEGQKSKLLTLLRILEQKTDEEHLLNVPQLVQLLEQQGILAERKSIYSDLEALQSFGLDLIRVRDGNITCWYIGERVFQLPELRLLADSVQSSRFITRKKSLELIAKLEGLTSVHQAKELRRQVVRSVRQQAYGPDGRTAATAETDRETVLVSAYEGRQVLEALAELTSAPEVWIARDDTYTPVDIASDEAVVQRHGTLSCLEIAVRPKRKTRTSWN